jgi:hypothetical protein
MFELLVVYVALIGLWMFFRPWERAPEWLLFYFCLQPVPAYVSVTSSGSLRQAALSSTIWALGSFLVMLKLRRSGSLAELFSTKNQAADAVPMSLVIAFYLLCGLYVVLYR